MLMRRLGVLGWPVAHSRSPAIHRAAFAALGLNDLSYQRLPVPPELFAETTRALPGAGFIGANVTVPHKLAALELADVASDAARAIGAVNTLTFQPDGSIHGENTDAPGFLAALERSVSGASALVLGAGGSARAVIWALLGAGARVSVWNRTTVRGAELAIELGAEHVTEAHAADVLVNCTSVGLDSRTRQMDVFDAFPLTSERLVDYTCVVDLVYGDRPSELLRAAQASGARTIDGVEVLVRQGALSFEHWTGIGAPLQAMRAAVREGGDDDG